MDPVTLILAALVSGAGAGMKDTGYRSVAEHTIRGGVHTGDTRP
jgi:hypothetical protein